MYRYRVRSDDVGGLPRPATLRDAEACIRMRYRAPPCRAGLAPSPEDCCRMVEAANLPMRQQSSACVALQSMAKARAAAANQCATRLTADQVRSGCQLDAGDVGGGLLADATEGVHDQRGDGAVHRAPANARLEGEPYHHMGADLVLQH